MLVIFFDCGGIIYQEFVPLGQMVNQGYYWEVLQHLREQVGHKCPNDSKTTTGSFTTTVRKCTLLCECSSFWPLETWLQSPTPLTHLIWHFMISSCFQE
jgi:hypothetical protein